MADSEMYLDIGMVKFMTREEAHDQFLLYVKRKILTFHSQNADMCMGKCERQSLKLICNYQSMQEYRQLLEEEIISGLVDNITMEMAWLLTAQSQNGIVYKDKPSGKVKVEILMNLRSLQWYYYFEELRNKSKLILLQLTLQSQLDGDVVDDMLMSWAKINLVMLQLIYQSQLDEFLGLGYYFIYGTYGIVWTDIGRKFLTIDWCLKKRELTFKSQWPVKEKVDYNSYVVMERGWVTILYLVCFEFFGQRRGVDWVMDWLWADYMGWFRRLVIMGYGMWQEWAECLLMDWRSDSFLKEAFIGIKGLHSDWFGLSFFVLLITYLWNGLKMMGWYCYGEWALSCMGRELFEDWCFDAALLEDWIL
ncbi:hypothetical protein QVD17_17829 [Tagetes erecta]|uniref:Uncharacterized protein n=1 Tax=Tagetes erecta TaxID=13708 RepID=A0AAD8KK14_TARER|nr:hypothetical protein QVD17_17829 [Tagetes erecta]